MDQHKQSVIVRKLYTSQLLIVHYVGVKLDLDCLPVIRLCFQVIAHIAPRFV